jgi:hypothetical protein
METARPFAPETRSRDRLRFGFRTDKPGKRPGFTDSTGEYRDTRTGWLRGKFRANPSLDGNSLLTGKITGNFAKSGPIGASVAGKRVAATTA